MTTEAEAVAMIDAADIEEVFRRQAQLLCDKGIARDTVEVAMGATYLRWLLETRCGPVGAAEELHRLARTLSAAGEPEGETIQ